MTRPRRTFGCARRRKASAQERKAVVRARQDLHTRLAAGNREFLDTIDVGHFPRWAITVAAYAALHDVEAFFARQGIDGCQRHSERLEKVTKHLPTEIAQAYEQLHQEGHRARYEDIEEELLDYVAHARTLIDGPMKDLRTFVSRVGAVG